MPQNEHCLAKGFTIPQKIYAQITFNVFWITGIVAIWQSSVIWALVYFALVVIAIPGLVQRHLVCPRCPHLYQYNDCLQVPAAVTKALVKKPTAMPLGNTEKALFVLAFAVITIFPQYWLWHQPTLLIVFWLSCGGWYAAQLLYFCKRCRVSSCPFCRAEAQA